MERISEPTQFWGRKKKEKGNKGRGKNRMIANKVNPSINVLVKSLGLSRKPDEEIMRVLYGVEGYVGGREKKKKHRTKIEEEQNQNFEMIKNKFNSDQDVKTLLIFPYSPLLLLLLLLLLLSGFFFLVRLFFLPPKRE